ncbi:MAG: xylulokinase [Promethearchaeota archaeon]
MSNLFLGLDCSTQSLTGLIINFDSAKVLFRYNINFEKDLPQYNTKNGIIICEDKKVVHSYPLMWVDALELLFDLFIKNSVPVKKIKAISGSAQQHGTIYLNKQFEKRIQSLNIEDSIANQLGNTFSRNTSPIWMDSSTSKQCEEIRERLGGFKETIKITGSNTFERFSGPQIRKFYQENPEEYENTAIIHLVSSFMASILLGRNAPIDHGDGAGMNLMNIKTKEWDKRALNATAPNLARKLPFLTNSNDIIGKISLYFVKKYGFNHKTILNAWSGDNPNSLIGLGLISKEKTAMSLGTSDTYFGYLKELKLSLSDEGHVFGAPTGDYMSLVCFKNGSLAREEIKNKYNLNWINFSNILAKTPSGNYGKVMLPFIFPEIVPLVLDPKIYRFGFDENDIEGNVRAIIEAQFLSMRLHSAWMGDKPKEIYVTGGASANKEILQIAANIFNTQIRIFEFIDSAALGAALRSAKSYFDSIKIAKTWKNIVNNFINIKESTIIKPEKKFKGLYDDMLLLYKKCEEYALNGKGNPEQMRIKFLNKYFQN